MSILDIELHQERQHNLLSLLVLGNPFYNLKRVLFKTIVPF